MHRLRNEPEVEQALAEDRVFLFKHSTRCGTSLRALREVTRYEESYGSARVFLVDVIEERDLSRTIADRLGIPHQSPQVILVSGGAAVWHASHGGVSAEALAEQDEKHAP